MSFSIGESIIHSLHPTLKTQFALLPQSTLCKQGRLTHFGGPILILKKYNLKLLYIYIMKITQNLKKRKKHLKKYL